MVNFYWTAMITPMQRNILLVVLFSVWIALSVAVSFYRRHIEAVLNVDSTNEAFRQAVALYLQRQWDGAETFILAQLKKNPQDVELLLLQTSLYRRNKRYDEARNVLNHLQRLEKARHWFVEIETEKRLLTEAQADE
jgi:predicted Zn-dependent protease